MMPAAIICQQIVRLYNFGYTAESLQAPRIDKIEQKQEQDAG